VFKLVFVTLVDYMRPQIVKILTLILFVFNSISMLGQTSNKSSGPPPPDQALAPPGYPIDDNVFILIVIGLVFGAYVAYKKQKANNVPS